MIKEESNVICETSKIQSSEEKIHPWRVCPIGKHYVKAYNKKHPDGTVTRIESHCALNPSKKDILTFDEIQEITKKYFQDLSGPPKENILKGYKYEDKFNSEIRGWVKYWNDIFSFVDPLEANLVKALMASESSFHSDYDIPAGKGKGRARGLMQITDETMNILADHHGELSNYLICFDHLKLFNPSANICAGVRWLFRKMILAESKLGRKATWIEAVAEYKGQLGIYPFPREMETFLHHYLCILEE